MFKSLFYKIFDNFDKSNLLKNIITMSCISLAFDFIFQSQTIIKILGENPDIMQMLLIPLKISIFKFLIIISSAILIKFSWILSKISFLYAMNFSTFVMTILSICSGIFSLLIAMENNSIFYYIVFFLLFVLFTYTSYILARIILDRLMNIKVLSKNENLSEKESIEMTDNFKSFTIEDDADIVEEDKVNKSSFNKRLFLSFFGNLFRIFIVIFTFYAITLSMAS